MTAATEAQDRAAIRWTLSLLPALVGLAGIVVMVLGAILSGIPDGRQGWTAIGIAAIVIAASVISGSSYGLYLALAILVAGGFVVDGGPSTAELAILVFTLVIVHEIVRFSLDTRRPSRLAPGLAVRYGLRSIVVAVLLVVAALAIEAFADRAPTNQFWIPVAVAVTAIPTFAIYGAERLQSASRFGKYFDSHVTRAVIAAVATAGIVAIVVVGAQARSSLVPTVADPAASVTGPTTTTTAPAISEVTTPGRTADPWMVAVAVAVIAVMIYFILRRPEAVFELEEAEQPIEDRSFELGATGLADSEAELVNLDSETLARLLGELQLDISSERDPSRAIRFGYATIEQRLADIGVHRADVETEREFLARTMTPLGSAAGAMTTLTGLFERARFGTDPVSEAMRAQALEAIDDLIAATNSSASGRSSGRGDLR